MRRFTTALLSLSLATPVAAQSPETPVLVRFGALAWIYASDGPPRLEGGVLLVPARSACALLGASCSPAPAFVPLRPLAEKLGLTVTWRPEARSAHVTGAFEGDLAQFAELLAERPRSSNDARLFASARPGGLSLRAEPAPITVLNVFSKLASGGLSIVGEAAPGTPDNPSVAFACSNAGGTCRLGLDRGALYALAQVR